MSPSTYPTEHVAASFPSPYVLLLSMQRAPVNAFNNALWFELAAHFDVASVDPEARVVVLASGLVKMFTAGLDLTCVPLLPVEEGRADAYEQGERYRAHAGD